MKILIVFIAILMFFYVSNVVYAGHFGPPEPATKEGESAGFGYFIYSSKWEPEDSEFGEVKIKQNQAYLQGGYYGPINNKIFEFYLRLGGADAKIKNAFLSDNTFLFDSVTSDFRDGFEFFFGAGFKGLLYSNRYFGVGPFLQANYCRAGYEDKNIRIKNILDVNLGVGLQSKILGVILYGGPVVYWSKLKAEVEDVFFGLKESTTYREKNLVGGFAGLRLPLGKGFNIEIEGQLKSGFSFGGALIYFSQ